MHLLLSGIMCIEDNEEDNGVLQRRYLYNHHSMNFTVFIQAATDHFQLIIMWQEELMGEVPHVCDRGERVPPQVQRKCDGRMPKLHALRHGGAIAASMNSRNEEQ